MSDLDVLWGGVVKNLDLDLAAHVVTISVQTLTAGVTANYRLTFNGVTLCTFSDEDSDSWDYVELTEIRMATMPNGQTVAEIVLWNEPAGLRVIADGWSVDDFAQDMQSSL